MKPLLQREWSLVRWPLAGALVAQLTFLFVQTPRTYSTLLERDPPIFGLLLAAWFGYHRFYAEQTRGTWLLQPFSRAQLVLGKLLPAGAALALFVLIDSLSRYAWVATSSAPDGPIRSLVPYLQDNFGVVLGAMFVALFASASASLAPHRSQQWVGLAAGLLWVMVVTLEGYQLDALLGSLWDESPRVWSFASLHIMLPLSAAVLFGSARSVGRESTPTERVARALWWMPVAAFALRIATSLLPEPERSATEDFESPVLLRDGEIVNAHFHGEEVRATRRDGRPVQLSPRWRSAPDEEVSWQRATVRADTVFGDAIWSPLNGNIFVAEDERSLLFFDGAQTGCWGAEGVRLGEVACAPTARILDVAQVHEEMEVAGVLVTTEDGVFALNGESREEFRGAHVLGAGWVGEDRPVLAVYTRDALQLRGRFERTCPAADLEDLVGVLDDDTVVAMHDDVLTYCGADGQTSTVPWPRDSTETSGYFDARMAILLPLAFNSFASPPTWWLAAVLRLLGAAIVIGIARKRGLIHALIGLVLGPGYLLASIVSETDVDMVAIVRERMLRSTRSR